MTIIKARLYRTAFDLASRQFVRVEMESYGYAVDGTPLVVFLCWDASGVFVGRRTNVDLKEFCL